MKILGKFHPVHPHNQFVYIFAKRIIKIQRVIISKWNSEKSHKSGWVKERKFSFAFVKSVNEIFQKFLKQNI